MQSVGEVVEEAQTPPPAGAGGQAEACPTFVLRADVSGHLAALIAATIELKGDDRARAALTMRQFELWREAERCR